MTASADTLTPASLAQAVQTVRAGGTRVATNFFAPPNEWPAAIDKGLYILSATSEFLLLGRTEKSCTRIYFVAQEGSLSAVTKVLSTFRGLAPLVVEVIGRGRQNAALIKDFTEGGFAVHGCLRRLARAGTFAFPEPPAKGPTCQLGSASDAAAILEGLDHSFDRLADRLPQAEEVTEALANGSILVCAPVVEGGFLWFEKQGATAHIRYWYTAPPARGKGVGSQLMRSYFAQAEGCARHILWVREDNTHAIACYAHYGYAADGLEDQVLVWGK